LIKEETANEIRQLHELNMELLETLYAVAQRFFEYANKYEIKVDGLKSLSLLTRKAERLMADMVSPSILRRNPIRQPDESLQGKKPDEDFTEPACSTFISSCAAVPSVEQ